MEITQTACEIPSTWSRIGCQLTRNKEGNGKDVVGDPAIVWDADLPGWRMFLFCSPPGHGQAVCRTTDTETIPITWESLAPLIFSNPEALLGGHTHKPEIGRAHV